jgi:predicted NAD-dependent protein-ADP-ribosyltransferase YbiA (DUF1768 family)
MRTYFIGFISLLLGCSSFSKETFNSQQYPDAWWAPVPSEDLKSWEIPPQTADRNKNEVILSKRTELAVFSNLAESPFILEGEKYQSVEGFWQSLKYPENPEDLRNNSAIQWKYSREQVMKMSGFEAKAAGDHANENMKKIGITWQSYKGYKFEPKTKDQLYHEQIIFRATEAKVLQNPAVSDLLKKTGTLILKPDHTQPSTITPAYKYYDMLMKIRAGL